MAPAGWELSHLSGRCVRDDNNNNVRDDNNNNNVGNDIDCLIV